MRILPKAESGLIQPRKYSPARGARSHNERDVGSLNMDNTYDEVRRKYGTSYRVRMVQFDWRARKKAKIGERGANCRNESADYRVSGKLESENRLQKLESSPRRR